MSAAVTNAMIELPERIQVSGQQTLQLRWHGNGRIPCLLVHGFAEGSHVWLPSMGSIGPSVRSVAVDLRGHGDSDWADPSTYNIETHTSDVDEVMRLLGSERRILIGHSMGAQILMRIAALRPAQVRALVLVDFGPERDLEARQRMLQLLRESLRQYESVAEYAQWLSDTRPLVPPDLIQHIALQSLRPVAGGYRLKLDPAVAGTLEMSSPLEDELLWKLLRDITCPVLLIRGGGSAVLSRQTAQRMVATLRNGRLVTVQAGHGVMMDSPHEFNDAVARFVREQVL